MKASIHETAIIAASAIIGENVEIGPFTIVGENVTIGTNTRIEAHCEIGVTGGTISDGALEIGSNCLIRSGTILYKGSKFGDGLHTGHKVTVREAVTAGDGLQLGTLCDIQGFCEFGDYVKLHSNVFISQSSILGSFIWIFPHVVLTDDPHPPSEVRLGCRLSDYCAIASHSTLLPGVHIGEGALVGAMSLVRDDVPENGICVGVPGKNIGTTENIKFKETGLQVYPWRRHFHRGYPDTVVKKWIAEFKNS